jgi:hypothetical protein
MFNYAIDWLRLIAGNMSQDIRRAVHIYWLYIILKPIRLVYNAFIQFSGDTLYDAKINGQLVKLERMLNDYFDPVLRRIYIDDGEYYEGTNAYSFYLDRSPNAFSYATGDGTPVYSYAVQGQSEDVDFIVYVPDGLDYDEILMTTKITDKKILGRSFKIEIIP